MNDTVVLCPPASVAFTVVPDVPLGTEKPHANAPELFVVSEPLEQPVIFTPSNTSDATGPPTENPVPDTTTPAPAGPCPGVTAIANGVTLNVAVADGPTTSVAVTVVPDVPLETEKEHTNPPELLVVSEPLAQAVIVTPSNTSDANAVDGENAVPETVTVVPNGPCCGVTLIAGAITVNVAEAMFVPSEATITRVPVGTVGITTVHEKLPFARDVVQVEAAVTRSNVKEMGSLAANPVPVAVVEPPTSPPVGLSESDASTVNISDAVFTPSVATIVYVPWGMAGIVTSHRKLPVVPDEQLEAADTPPRVKVIVLDAANPVPVAVVVVPTIPLAGLTENDAPTVNDAEALFVPSDTFIVCAPFGTAGIVTPHEKLPVRSDEQEGEVAATASSVNVIEALAANPLPVAVVVLPTTPPVGLNSRNANTLYVAGARFVPSNAAIVWMPWGTAGIVTPHEKLPVRSDEQEGEVAATASSVNVIEAFAANPLPVAVVVLPTTPLVGLNATSALTVNVAEAMFVPSDAFIV